MAIYDCGTGQYVAGRLGRQQGRVLGRVVCAKKRHMVIVHDAAGTRFAALARAIVSVTRSPTTYRFS